MLGNFFAMIDDFPRNGDQEDWNRWHVQLVASGNDLLEMVDRLLASSTDEAIEHRLEVHRARIISILDLAERILSIEIAGRTIAPTGGKLVH